MSVSSDLSRHGYFRKVIQHYAQHTLVLTRLFRKDRIGHWQWSPECQAAFEDIEHALITTPVLALPDFPSYLTLSVMHVSLAVVLFYCRMASLLLLKTGSRLLMTRICSVTEQELLACIHALNNWRCYVEGADTY